MMTKIQKLLKILLGIFISGFFLYLTFSEVNLKAMLSSAEDVDFFYIFISLILVFLTLFIKSIRWASILNPITHINQKDLFPISSIGIAAITILPLRLGEIVRPYLLSKAKNISFSLALASIVFERIVDSMMLVALLSLILIFSSLPSLIVITGKVLFFSVSSIFLILIFIYKYQKKAKSIMQKLLIYLPKKMKITFENIFDKFFEGLTILSNPVEIIKFTILSLILWFIYGLIVFYMFSFHNFALPFVAAFSVVLITFLASSLPAAPGFLGTFQYGCFLALTSYGVKSDDAAFFSITYYFVMIGMNILVGLFFFLRSPIKLFNVNQ